MKWIMMKDSVSIFGTLGICLLLCLLTLGESAVTWRRATRPPPTTPRAEVSTSTAKSAVTWKRSTLSRRSTAESEPPSTLEEEIEAADSKEELTFVEEGLENDSSYKPLVPGSRPGFWFDSSRRNKPSRLLRPGSRRNSLFPTKPSTIETTTESSTSTPSASATPTAQESTSDSKFSTAGKSKLFSKNRSTKSPVSFRRRIKTTKAIIITPAVHEEKENLIEKKNSSLQPDNVKEQPKNELPKSNAENEASAKNVTEKPQTSFKFPVTGIKRRVRNGTRLSWSAKRGNSLTRTTTHSSTTHESVRSTTRSFDRVTRKTTTTPKTSTTRTNSPKTNSPRTRYTKTNSPRTSSYETSYPKTRSRTRLHKTTVPARVSWTRNQPTTAAPDVSTKEIDEATPSKFKGSNDYLRNRNTHRFDRLKTKPFIKKENEKNYQTEAFTEKEEEIENSAILISKKEKTFHPTAEPFYITREYGQVVTTIPFENNRKRGRLPPRTTKLPKQSTVKEVLLTTSTELPIYTQQLDYTELDYNNEFVKFDDDYVKNEEQDEFRKADEDFLDQELQVNRTLSRPEISQNLVTIPVTTATPSVATRASTFESLISITPPPALSTIDSGTNGYVVWSLGQDGSGWSYQKQGGHVKWSAQNSDVEGDRWSVQGKEEPIDYGDNTPWSPVRNTTYLPQEKQFDVGAQKFPENGKFEKVPATISYTSNVPYISETPLKFKTESEDFRWPPLNKFNTYSEFPPSTPHFSPDVTENTVTFSTYSINKSNTPVEVPKQPFNIETYSTDVKTKIDDYETELNATVEAKPNPLLNTPYLAEIRETFIPSFVMAEASTENIASDIVKETVSPTTSTPELEEEQPDQSYNTAADYQVSNPTPLTEESSDFSISDLSITTTPSPTSTERVLENFKSDLSGIPPQLAKAVVEAKRWKIVGTGGPDGWSLLGENGKLEWKIHNIGGKWSVTSADQLINNGPQEVLPYQGAPDLNEEDQTEENETEKASGTKVWTLEDDYEKWRAVSSEGLSPPEETTEVNSPQENWESNKEYEDYGEDGELREEYFDDNINYNNEEGEDVNEGIEGGHFNNDESINLYREDFEGRPLWGENQMIRNPKDDYINYQFHGKNIETVNSKEDAIEAWKSLLSDVGKWKVDEGKFENEFNPTASPSKIHNQNIPEIDTDWKVSSRPITIREKKINRFNDYSPQPFEHDYFEESEKLAEQKISEHAYNEKIFEDNYLKRQNPAVRYRNEEKTAFENDYKNDGSFEENSNIDIKSEGRAIIENDPNYELKPNNVPKEDHEKLEKLINKLETINKETNGKAIVDLSQLLKLIKVNRNSTKHSSVQNNKADSQKPHFIPSHKYNKEQFQDSLSRFPENKQNNQEIIKYPNHQYFNTYQRAQEDIPLYSDVPNTPSGNSRSDTIYNRDIKNHERYLNREVPSVKLDAGNHQRYLNGISSIKANGENHQRYVNAIPSITSNSERPQQYLNGIPVIESNVENYQRYSNGVPSIKSNEFRVDSQRTRNTVHNKNKISSDAYQNENLPSRDVTSQLSKYIPSPTLKEQQISIRPREKLHKSQNHGVLADEISQRYKSRGSGTAPEVRETFTSEEELVSVREQPQLNYRYESVPKPNTNTHRRKRPMRRRHRKPSSHHNPAPIVLSGETLIEDEEGTKKSRKIIVIDYAGKQKKKSSIERKDLELIIRNVRNRRSESITNSSTETENPDLE